ncbi:MAG: PEP-utilizing enzyme, partial [Deinococcales bacterium]
HRAHHAALARAGEEAVTRLARAARRGPWGWLRGPVVTRLARAARILPALREHPKFLLVKTLARVRPVLLDAGASLARAGRLERAEDVWWLTFPELEAAVAGMTPASAAPPAAERQPGAGDLRPRVERRKRDQQRFARLVPPRLVTSDGLVPPLNHRTGILPPGALPGSAVSPGVVEGRARVVLDPVHAGLQPGEILVAPFTDPGWTPLFTQAAGLVMEVGGLMTHGSVVAREYGLPAVVGVEGATARIVTGQRVRVHGDEGYVELLEDDHAEV